MSTLNNTEIGKIQYRKMIILKDKKKNALSVGV